MRKTLEHLERLLVPEEEATPSATNFPLINSLVGLNQPAWSKTVPPTIAEPESTEIRWFGERLNDSQKEAIDFCLRAETVACIHGPPGVGLQHP
jgi:DNA polymerase alpha-associated DNA helicase A